MKILTVVGARPQFIKAAALSRAIREENDITEILVHTGQHFDANMSNVFFEQMEIPRPDYNLEVNSLSHGAMTGRMLEKIEEVILKEQPDWVLVYGDTDSTLAGALAAKKLHVKLAHVEAGLRSFNMKMPEEVNRILADRISNILFCPTETAVENLQKEGYDHFDTVIRNTGDIMYDAALFYSERAEKPGFKIPERYVLATVHRAESTNSKEDIGQIFDALKEIASEIPVVLPLHPRTGKKLQEFNINAEAENLIITDPVGYLEIVWLLKHSSMVITDSGGMQKEAFFFEKPCVTMRDETEWTELVNNGFNKVAGRNTARIAEAFHFMQEASPDFKMNLYGKGDCAANIIRELRNYQQ
jgi:UDP-GlcNAc3NAcA epimerase